MLVLYLGHSIYEEFSARAMNESEACFFSEIAIAFRHGHCYLCGDSYSLEYCENSLGYPAGKIYGTVISHRSEHRSVMEAVSIVFILTMKEKEPVGTLPRFLRERENDLRFLPLSDALRWNLNQPCLLGENPEDCAFYEKIASYLIEKRKLRGIYCSFHHENGGGDTISRVLEKCVSKDQTPTLCIVDSDRKCGSTKPFPEKAKVGNTLKKCQETAEKLQCAHQVPFCVLPLDTHEVENLIPFRILRKIGERYPDMTSALSVLSQLRCVCWNNMTPDAQKKLGRSGESEFVTGEPMRYYDLKRGFPYIQGKPERTYWEVFICLLNGTPENMPPESKPKNGEIMESGDLFYPKLSCGKTGLLECANSLMGNNYSEYFFDDAPDSYLSGFWDDIGQTMLTWGCARTPQYDMD